MSLFLINTNSVSISVVMPFNTNTNRFVDHINTPVFYVISQKREHNAILLFDLLHLFIFFKSVIPILHKVCQYNLCRNHHKTKQFTNAQIYIYGVTLERRRMSLRCYRQ